MDEERKDISLLIHSIIVLYSIFVFIGECEIKIIHSTLLRAILFSSSMIKIVSYNNPSANRW